MSLNQLTPQNFILDLQSLMSLLSDSIFLWKEANTEEQKALIEANIVNMIEKLLELDFSIEHVRAGLHPEVSELKDFYDQYFYLIKSNYAQLQTLINLFILHFNSQQFVLQELIGRIKRINQKQSVLSLLDSAYNFAFSEKFLTFDNIKESKSNNECKVHTDSGFLTLPVKSSTKVDIKNIIIASGSNGLPGNSNIDVTTTNIDLKSLTKDDSSFFEYERLNTGPCNLNLLCSFNGKQIINKLVIKPVANLSVLGFEIVDILFNTFDNKSVSIKELLPESLDKNFFNIKLLNNDTEWSVVFLPIECDSFVLQVKGSNNEIVKTATTIKKRYPIALKAIECYSVVYEPSGTLESKVVEIPEHLSSGIGFINLAPKNSSLFTSSLDISTDGGSNWELDKDSDNRSGSLFLINDTKLNWRLSLQRVSDAFKSYSVPESENNIFDYSFLLKNGSKNLSPLEVEIPDKAEKIIAYQTKLIRRGDKSAAIKIAEGKNSSVNVLLPIEFSKERQINAFRVLVDNKDYARVASNPSTGQYAFNEDFTELIFSTDIKLYSEIKILLKKEKLNFIKTADGFIAETEFPIDPDKDSIQIEYLNEDFKRYSVSLDQDETTFFFGVKNIKTSSFELVSDDGTVFTSVNNIADLNTNTEYYLDGKSGILYLYEVPGIKKITAYFVAQNSIVLPSENFKIGLKNNIPNYIIINDNSFLSEEKKEKISDTLGVYTDIVLETVRTRTPYFSNNTLNKQLSNDSIIPGTLNVSADLLLNNKLPQEIQFIDGKKEFLGLIKSENEKTLAIESGLNNYVQFTLAAAELYSGEKVFFENSSVFANLVNTDLLAMFGSVGDYHVSASGVVTVNIGVAQTLEADIAFVYYYRDPTFVSDNKYSVNYKKGILYTATTLNPNATVSYKVANYKASYNVCKVLKSKRTSNNILSVYTEDLKEINNTVKIAWAKKENNNNLVRLENYFSPIIDSVGFRMY